MIAVDTNILVRWITRDDDVQAAQADRIMGAPVLIPLTVLLETAWVLGGRTYRFDRPTLASALLAMLDLASVTVPQEADVRWAIGRFAAGADLADMMHIVAALGASRFASFERDLATAAGLDAPTPVERVG